MITLGGSARIRAQIFVSAMIIPATTKMTITICV
jgi:hypothetical protein